MGLKEDKYDVIVIGAGFYGCFVAIELSKQGKTVALLENEADIMQRASYNNQARIHQGYHYPRSVLTAFRSRFNFNRFAKEFNESVFSEFDMYYAIGKIASKVNANQFSVFCKRIGAPLQKASKQISSLFDPNLIEAVFKVREYAFDAVKLKKQIIISLDKEGVDIGLNCRALKIRQSDTLLKLDYTDKGKESRLISKYIFNCTYSSINQINDASNLKLVALKHELTEMAVVEMPEELVNFGFTVMDGPFFSIMPFPARGLHTLSHVRYTPHNYWQDDTDKAYFNPQQFINNNRFKIPPGNSYYVHMLKDAQRYIPALKDCRYIDSMWEIKTVLPQSEIDDSRPILFRRSDKLNNVISIMGGKIDNVFDIKERLKKLLDTEWSK